MFKERKREGFEPNLHGLPRRFPLTPAIRFRILTGILDAGSFRGKAPPASRRSRIGRLRSNPFGVREDWWGADVRLTDA